MLGNREGYVLLPALRLQKGSVDSAGGRNHPLASFPNWGIRNGVRFLTAEPWGQPQRCPEQSLISILSPCELDQYIHIFLF